MTTVVEVVQKLSQEYARHSSVNTSVEITAFFESALKNTPQGNKSIDQRIRKSSVISTIKALKELEEHIPDKIPTTDIQYILANMVESRTASGKQVALHTDFFDDVVAFIATVVDLKKKYPDITLTEEIDSLVEATKLALEGDLNGGARELRAAGMGLAVRAILVRRGEMICDSVADMNEPQFSKTKQDIKTEVSTAIRTGDKDILQNIVKSIQNVTDRNWTYDDLMKCSYQEFEVLICDLWREGGFKATTTRFSQDFNIDVIVTKPNGSIDLIQAKQKRQENTVGVKTVQRTAGLIPEFNADEVYVVTSSSFTASAEESASRMDEKITLIDGDWLCDLLTQSPLVPPL